MKLYSVLVGRLYVLSTETNREGRLLSYDGPDTSIDQTKRKVDLCHFRLSEMTSLK